MHVRLSPKHENQFQRSIRDKNGKILEMLTFAPGQVIELSPDQVEAVKYDIGKALQAVNFNEHNSPIPVEVSLTEINVAIADARKPKLSSPSPEVKSIPDPSPGLPASPAVAPAIPPANSNADTGRRNTITQSRK